MGPADCDQMAAEGGHGMGRGVGRQIASDGIWARRQRPAPGEKFPKVAVVGAPGIRRRVIDLLHRLLGNFERELAQSAASSQLIEYETRIARIESTVQLLKVPRRFEVDLQRLRIHLRMLQEELDRMRAVH